MINRVGTVVYEQTDLWRDTPVRRESSTVPGFDCDGIGDRSAVTVGRSATIRFCPRAESANAVIEMAFADRASGGLHRQSQIRASDC